MPDQTWTRPPEQKIRTMAQLRSLPLYRLIIILGLPLVFMVGFIILYNYDPAVGLPILPCLFYEVTGLDCISCGLTRSLHALVHGDIPAALSYNLIMPFWLMLPAYALLGEWLQALAGHRVLPVLRDRRWLLILLLVSSLLFMILRNLPWWPFSWLAA
ncbi:MAG TPA: DUF2752 domain-containing protein [Clostridiales bacterium]|nr:DUF2752 domain-containing protein [Clostridiales bacterium]